MDITFSANNREEVVVLPVVPPEIKIKIGQANEGYSGLSKNINLIGNVELRTVEISSIFVNRKYPWIRSKSSPYADTYINFFEKWRNRHVPIRIVITNKDGSEYLNMACSVDTFEYYKDQAGDIPYTLSLTEYFFIGDNSSKKTYTDGLTDIF